MRPLALGSGIVAFRASGGAAACDCATGMHAASNASANAAVIAMWSNRKRGARLAPMECSTLTFVIGRLLVRARPLAHCASIGDALSPGRWAEMQLRTQALTVIP